MNRLKELRTKYGLSLRKLQEYTGVDFSRLAIIEKTDANLELKTIDKLTGFFKVSNTYLFGRDGFIYYYDEADQSYFPMAFEQYKNILTDDVVSFSIVDGCVRRIISLEGYDRIDRYENCIRKSLDIRLTTERYIDFLRDLDSFEYSKQKEVLQDFLEIEEIRRNR